jgi:5-formyltetrahydrofolate cyclo-ligase
MRMVRDMVDDRLIRSVQLWAQVAALPEYAAAGTVMAFVGVKGEPDTDGLFARLAADGKTLVLPRMVDRVIEPALVGSGLVAAPFELLEPTGAAVDPQTIDLVIVPGLAFTATGARLGYGGGNYDRFLPKTRAATVGVCFTEQLVDELPLEPHDLPVGTVVAA